MENTISYNSKYGKVEMSSNPAASNESKTVGTYNHLKSLQSANIINLSLSSDGTVRPLQNTSDEITTTNVSVNKGNSYGLKMNAAGTDIDYGGCDATANTIKVETLSGNTFGVKLKADGTIDHTLSTPINTTIDISDDPTNTYGLASKVYLYSTILNHSNDPSAHSDVFNGILQTLTDLYLEKGKLRAKEISDAYGNIVYANGKVIVNGDTTHPKYLMLSNDRHRDYDSAITALSGALDSKQIKLTPVPDGDVQLDANGNISVTDMRYNDTAIMATIGTLSGNVTTLNGNVITLSNSVNNLSNNVQTLGTAVSAVTGTVNTLSSDVQSLKSKETTWDNKQDKINSPADIGAQPAGTYVTSDSQLKIKVVAEEPAVKEENTLYFIMG